MGLVNIFTKKNFGSPTFTGPEKNKVGYKADRPFETRCKTNFNCIDACIHDAAIRLKLNSFPI